VGGPQSADVARLRAAWPTIVGETHAQLSRVTGLVGGAVLVTASSDAAAKELRYLESHVVRAVNLLMSAGVARAMTVRVGALPPEETTVRGARLLPPPVRALSEGEEAQCEQTAQVIADPELRKVFEGWMRRHMEVRPAGRSGASGDEQ
jgi:hypothetical protein